MDILFHILAFIGIGFLFFIYLIKDKKERSITPLLLVTVVTVLMFAITWQDTTYITTGYNTTATIVNGTVIGAITQPIKTVFAFEWALYLAYGFLFVLSAMLSFTGGEYGTN